jgi:hypothetical protein
MSYSDASCAAVVRVWGCCFLSGTACEPGVTSGFVPWALGLVHTPNAHSLSSTGAWPAAPPDPAKLLSTRGALLPLRQGQGWAWYDVGSEAFLAFLAWLEGGCDMEQVRACGGR